MVNVLALEIHNYEKKEPAVSRLFLFFEVSLTRLLQIQNGLLSDP